MTLRLQRLQIAQDIVTDARKPTNVFQIWWMRVSEAIEGAINDLAQAVLDIQTAQNTADGVAADLAALMADPDPFPQYLDASEVPSRAKLRFVS